VWQSISGDDNATVRASSARYGLVPETRRKKNDETYIIFLTPSEKVAKSNELSIENKQNFAMRPGTGEIQYGFRAVNLQNFSHDVLSRLFA